MNHILKDERERGWFHLDNAIIDEYLPKIGPTAFAVYACIVRHSDRRGDAFPSYTLLQRELNTGRHQIAAAIKKLVDAGLVTITKGKRASNVYHIVTVSTSAESELVLNRNQFPSGTDTSSSPAPELVPNRHSNNTQLTRPIEQDPIVAIATARAKPNAKPPVVRLADFAPSAAQIADAVGYGVPEEQIAFQTEQWRDYHAERGTAIKDFGASWRRWMRNAPGFERPRAGSAANGRASPNGAYLTAGEKNDQRVMRMLKGEIGGR